MKITSVETYVLKHALRNPGGPAPAVYHERDLLVVKMGTDDGLVGWGETAVMGGVRATIEQDYKPRLLGRDPLERRRLWRELWGANFGNPLALGAVDIALHDLAGKALNLPIAELYGGRLRSRVLAYASTLGYPEGRAPEQAYPEEAAELAAQGFRVIKMRIGGVAPRRDLAAMAAVREAVGPDVLLAADGNGAYTLPAAIAVGRELERLGFYWFEEPLPQAGYVGYERLTDQLDIAIAAGEALGSRLAFKELMERRATDIVQPDISLAGGIGEGIFIAEMGRLWSIPTVPHCFGGAIVVAATLHMLAVQPDTSWSRYTEEPMIEMDVSENHFMTDLVSPALKQSDGSVDVPGGPGLGIEIDEAALRHYAAD